MKTPPHLSNSRLSILENFEKKLDGLTPLMSSSTQTRVRRAGMRIYCSIAWCTGLSYCTVHSNSFKRGKMKGELGSGTSASNVSTQGSLSLYSFK
ncbi:hypothetical protein AGABI1DRAFT_116771 [Agaricus bisporus var. burnettii JB137-S8]|uniref:Uncharacterized protein n=1 Tax=Agaricus bisporus var. burnettii (strain JB137-S8 / ATCC MYA-4627 / FGSC 10392) TaxID=597362 RepID=K5WVW1_AGABU|nr:uncharacterized protein AGABI1DRAFT_116771 [Agaricus bisporus var. burnettii JB137-S8]EKM74692.1 hypothetical protein AGABI1DRAFT_116771 [Agaricus bisporus var. burnettii JB137-S8]